MLLQLINDPATHGAVLMATMDALKGWAEDTVAGAVPGATVGCCTLTTVLPPFHIRSLTIVPQPFHNRSTTFHSRSTAVPAVPPLFHNLSTAVPQPFHSCSITVHSRYSVTQPFQQPFPPVESRIECTWSQRLQLRYDKTAFEFCFQFQLVAIHHGRGGGHPGAAQAA
jgi:hypothetical protein